MRSQLNSIVLAFISWGERIEARSVLNVPLSADREVVLYVSFFLAGTNFGFQTDGKRRETNLRDQYSFSRNGIIKHERIEQLNLQAKRGKARWLYY